MNAKRLPLTCLLGLIAGCYAPADENNGPVGQQTAAPQTNEERPFDVQECIDTLRTYSDRLADCYAEVDAIPDEHVEAGCEPDKVWYDCVDEIEDFNGCQERVGCESWHGAMCWAEYRGLTVCLGEPDPGAQPPACPWTNDGECDEPEGLGVCVEGTDVADCDGPTGGPGNEPAATCDSAACSGCVSDCDEWGCYQCCWGCNGDVCEETCNF